MCSLPVQLSITCARIGRKQVGLVGLAFPILRIRWWLTFYGDVRPDLSIFRIDLEPLFETGLCVRFDCVNRAFRFANAAIDAFVGVNDEHVLALVEAVHRNTSTQSMYLQRMQASVTT